MKRKLLSRKLLSATLALCLIMGCSTTAFATDITPNTAGNSSTAGVEAAEGAANGDVVGTADIPVYVKTTIEDEVTNVYSVSYDATELTFEYEGTDNHIWNPETLEYEATHEGDWTNPSQDITVSNYSDLPVLVTPSATDPTDTNLTVKLGAALALDSAYNEDEVIDNDASKASVKEGTINVSIEGTPSVEAVSPTQVSTITLTVTDNR